MNNCTICGKEIGYGEVVCEKCAQNSAKKPKRGLKQGLIAAISGFIGYNYLAAGAFGMSLGMLLTTANGTMFWFLFAIFSVLLLGAFAASVAAVTLSVINGIRAIGIFKNTPAEKSNPVAALILGIVGLYFSAFAVLFLVAAVAGYLLTILMLLVV